MGKNLILFSSVFSNAQIMNHLKDMCPRKNMATYIPASTMFSTFGDDSYKNMGFKHSSCFDIGYNYDESKTDDLFSSDLIHIGGGNTFLLKYLLKKRGLMNKLFDFASNGGVIIGNSAGSIMMCGDIHIASIADENITNEKDYAGLGLVDFDFKPHFQMFEENIRYFEMYSEVKNKVLYGVDESSAIVIKNDRLIKVGNVKTIIPTKLR